jgi:hypothetical protein
MNVKTKDLQIGQSDYFRSRLEISMDRQVRLLLAWLEEHEAITNLLGHLPTPGEDTTAHRERSAEARQAVNARAPYARKVIRITAEEFVLEI